MSLIKYDLDSELFQKSDHEDGGYIAAYKM